MHSRDVGLARRLGMTTVDQIVAGGSNVLTAVLAAHVLDIAAFGLFTLAFLVYVAAQTALRALVCDPLLVHPAEIVGRTGEIIRTALTVSTATAAILAAGAGLAAWWDGGLALALAVLAVVFPWLCLQDLGRYLAFAEGRPQRAVELDTLWLLLLLVNVTAVALLDVASVAAFTAAWGVAGAMAGGTVLVRRRLGGLRPGITWLRTTWRFSWRYLVSAVWGQLTVLGAALGLGLVAGGAALGGVRAAQLLVRPFQALQYAAVASGTAEVSRAADHSRVVSTARRLTLATGLGAALNLVVLVFLPDSIGELLLGNAWSTAQPLLLPVAGGTIFVGLMSGARAGVLGLRAVRVQLALDLTTGALLLVLIVAGALAGGAATAMWCLASGQALVALAWWAAFLGRVRRSGGQPQMPLPLT